MKILLLTDPSAAHSIKWITSLSSRGLDVMVFSLTDYDASVYESFNNIKIFCAGIKESKKFLSEKSLSKLIYIKYVGLLKKIIKQFNPDIVHAHYASSYGLLGALSGFHPYIISVWGTDILSFPKLSYLHQKIIEHNLNKADLIMATSRYLANETRVYCSTEIVITNFGVDVDIFKPNKNKRIFKSDEIVVGTIKTLEKNYGVDILLCAFAKVIKKHPIINLRLLIVGGGSEFNFLKKLASQLNIVDRTIFTGKVNYMDINNYHNSLTISVIPSLRESFGVSAVESSACEVPVIASKVGGLPEIIEDGVTGLLVPPGDENKLMDAIEKLILSPQKRLELGKNGRKRVLKEFNWEKNLNNILNNYYRLIIK